jgi:carbamoyl-phosphate synthase large subunit
MSDGGIATVLVLGVGGNVSQSSSRRCARDRRRSRIVAACISPISAGLYAGDVALLSPRADEAGFADWVADVCLREHVDGVFSGVEPVLLALAPHAASLRARGAARCSSRARRTCWRSGRTSC